jgi:hypothetical protein
VKLRSAREESATRHRFNRGAVFITAGRSRGRSPSPRSPPGVLYYAFAAFLVPMQQELGWSRTTVTGAYSLGLLVSGLAAPHYGSTGGMVSVFVTGARTLAPESAGAISAALGGYDPVLWMLVSGSALGAIAIYVAQWNLHTPNGGSRGRSRRGRAWRLDHWRRSRTPALPGLTRGPCGGCLT